MIGNSIPFFFCVSNYFGSRSYFLIFDITSFFSRSSMADTSVPNKCTTPLHFPSSTSGSAMLLSAVKALTGNRHIDKNTNNGFSSSVMATPDEVAESCISTTGVSFFLTNTNTPCNDVESLKKSESIGTISQESKTIIMDRTSRPRISDYVDPVITNSHNLLPSETLKRQMNTDDSNDELNTLTHTNDVFSAYPKETTEDDDMSFNDSDSIISLVWSEPEIEKEGLENDLFTMEVDEIDEQRGFSDDQTEDVMLDDSKDSGSSERYVLLYLCFYGTLYLEEIMIKRTYLTIKRHESWCPLVRSHFFRYLSFDSDLL